jgi:hypothetical protein
MATVRNTVSIMRRLILSSASAPMAGAGNAAYFELHE